MSNARTQQYKASKLAEAIQARKSYEAGALRGEAVMGWYEAGRLSMAADLNRWRADRDLVTYVIRSYATPIAWLAAGEWYVVGEKFSPTSGQHVAVVRQALDLVYPEYV